MAETNAYFRNFISLLNLRLFTLLALCPPENREEVQSSIADMIDPSEDLDAGVSREDLLACQKFLETFTQEHETLLAESRQSGILPRIEQIRERFSLNREEMLLLTAVLAPVADERIRKIYRLFQRSDDPRMDFLLSFLEPDRMGRFAFAELLGTEGKLLSHGLIEAVGGAAVPGPSTAFRPGPGILSWLNGVRSLDVYHGMARWVIPSDHSDDKGLAHKKISAAANAISLYEAGNELPPLVSFSGPDEERLFAAAEELGVELKRPLIRTDMRGLSISDMVSILKYCLRDAMLNDGLPVLIGVDSWIDSTGVFSSEIGHLFDSWRVPVILLSEKEFVLSSKEMRENRLILRIAVEGLTGIQRVRVWKEKLATLGLDSDFDEETLRTLAGQFTMNTSQINAAVNAGFGKAVIEDRDLTIMDLYEGARLSSMHHLEGLANKIPQRYTLADLVLPEKQAKEINELIAMARNRSHVLEDLGVGKKLVSGRGISALFTGVPGTGKTLSAQAIAGELGLDLYRVDLSTIVSKYIGETEKNLEHVFTEAQSSNVILFFDEADSLFGRRSEVGDSHDRYANIEVGYLLQRIEIYDGIVLMATNLGANLDEAFARRINFIIDFPFPDEETRLRLWQLLLPENIEKDPDIDLEPFAYAYKIAGGNIRNAVVWAIYEATRNKRPLSVDDLLNGVEREYQKMGKVFQRIR